jgi:hypothetical protein
MKKLKILLSNKRKIKKYATSKIEVVLFDKENYKVAVRTIEGITGLVDYLQDIRKQGLKAERIMRENINGMIWTIYKLNKS